MRRILAISFTIIIVTGNVRAGAGTVLQFFQSNANDQVTATDNAGVTSLSTAGNTDGGGVSIPVFLTGTNIPPGTQAYETYVGVHSIGIATLTGGVIDQPYAGTIEFTSGIGGAGTNYLTAVFANAGIAGVSGASGGDAATLAAAQPPDSLVLTSDVMGMLVAPTSMGIGYSNVLPFLTIAGDGSIGDFVAQNAGTFGANSVPEPGSIALLGIGMAGFLAFRRFRKRAA